MNSTILCEGGPLSSPEIMIAQWQEYPDLFHDACYPIHGRFVFTVYCLQ